MRYREAGYSGVLHDETQAAQEGLVLIALPMEAYADGYVFEREMCVFRSGRELHGRVELAIKTYVTEVNLNGLRTGIGVAAETVFAIENELYFWAGHDAHAERKLLFHESVKNASSAHKCSSYLN